ncbi:predicted protein [Methanosarcina acetivorans C2A]|uniref:Uncharacterized protein n=1 Tax=Methanosarcina acetivorans (strain ATCC 35395 / DSM 2834 / JCM 12185 / C2A) TaxID=188937 RepID=Q8TNJ2_METAC|nr:predicted protein [Methanosarcina acetivorans C2A]
MKNGKTSIGKFFHPPGAFIAGNILKVIFLRLHPFSTPFMCVVEDGSVFSKQENVTPASPTEHTNLFKGNVDVPLKDGRICEHVGNFKQYLFNFQFVPYCVF